MFFYKILILIKITNYVYFFTKIITYIIKIIILFNNTNNIAFLKANLFKDTT